MTFFWVRYFGKDFLGGLTKSETQGSRFCVKKLYQFNLLKKWWTQKLSGILLNYYYCYYYFNWTFFGLRSGPLDFFWV